MSDLEKRVDDYPDLPPESWRPKPGDEIAREPVSYDQADGGC